MAEATGAGGLMDGSTQPRAAFSRATERSRTRAVVGNVVDLC
jgi:hypothetical protein